MPKKLVLYAEDRETILAELDVEQVRELIQDDTSLPKNLEWYKESLTWFITLAIGAAVLGLGFFDKGTPSALQRYGFAFGGMILGLAIFCGLWAHRKLLIYANLRERGKSREDQDAKLQQFNNWYGWSLRFFFAGLIAFGFVAMVKVLTAAGEEPTNRPLTPSQPFTWSAATQGLQLLRDDQRKGLGLRPQPKANDVVTFDGKTLRACPTPAFCKTITVSCSVWIEEKDVVTAPHLTGNVRERVRRMRNGAPGIEQWYLDEHGRRVEQKGAVLKLFDTP